MKHVLLCVLAFVSSLAYAEPAVVCFSPDEGCDVKLSQFVQSAQQSIDVAIFDFNLDKLAHDLLVQSRKVRVRVLADLRQAKNKERSLIPMLTKAGVQVRYGRQRGIMHNKFMIIDGKKLETGSFNYTNGAAFKNAENQIYLSEPEIIRRYQERFEKLWRTAKLVKSSP